MNKKNSPEKTGAAARRSAGGRIHPVVIYPFRPATDYSDLAELYQMVARLEAQRDRYARPLTVVDRKTIRAMEGNRQFLEFRQQTVARVSEVVEAWCVDTCQMWNTGLGRAFDQGAPGDIYWLIPGDFNYGSALGREVLGKLHDLPEIIGDLNQDFCVGEITTDHNHSKELIDTYGTFALLYTWFPKEAQEIRKITEHPRSEFFAVRHDFLAEMLGRRWYPYEQTMIMLLSAVSAAKRVSRFSVGEITDLPHGRDSFASAVQQVERTELALKMYWREHHQEKPGWFAQYRALEAKSERARGAALDVLRELLS